MVSEISLWVGVAAVGVVASSARSLRPVEAPGPHAQPIALRSTQSWRSMAQVGLKMLLHDRLKLIGILIGVISSVVLINVNAGIFITLLGKNTAIIDHAHADVWIVPPSTDHLTGSGLLSDRVLALARSTPGVRWAAPALMGTAGVRLPDGGSKPIQLIGVDPQSLRGGPWSVVAGRPADLATPDAIFMEDSEREKLGGLNLGSVREVNGHQVHVVGFTVGLLPFGPPYSFTSFDTARELLGIENHRVSYAMIGLSRGAQADRVVAELQRRIPEAQVLTSAALKSRTVEDVLVESDIGKSIGTSTAFAVAVGFVIVALTMFSAVLDHVREFGTLKAIGATNLDLAKLLIVQSVACAVVGTFLGEGIAAQAIRGMHNPKMQIGQPAWLVGVTFVGMLAICTLASTLALLRLRKVEPGIVFRG